MDEREARRVEAIGLRMALERAMWRANDEIDRVKQAWGI
jgi:hypothetical protein